jgi:regulatory protein spx
MIKLFCIGDDLQTQAVEQFFKLYNIPFEKHDLERETLSFQDAMALLAATDNGFEDLMIPIRYVWKELGITSQEYNALSIKQLISMIQNHPKILVSPIVLHKNKLQVGIDLEGLRKFIPAQIRNAEMKIFLSEIGMDDERLVNIA